MGWNKGVPEGGKRWTEKRREKEEERRQTDRGRWRWKWEESEGKREAEQRMEEEKRQRWRGSRKRRKGNKKREGEEKDGAHADRGPFCLWIACFLRTAGGGCLRRTLTYNQSSADACCKHIRAPWASNCRVGICMQKGARGQNGTRVPAAFNPKWTSARRIYSVDAETYGLLNITVLAKELVATKKKNKQKRIFQISPACTWAAGSIEAAGLWSSQRFLSGRCGEHTAFPRVAHLHANTLYRTHQRNKYKHDAAEHAWNTLVYPIFFFFSPPLIFKSITHYSSSWRSGVAGPGIHHSSAHARVFSPASRTGASIGTERRDALPRSTEDIYFKFSSRLPKLFFFFFKKIPETVCQDESWGNMCKVMRRTNISPSPFNHTESRVLKTWLAERVTLSYMERFKGETQQLKILDLLDVGGLTSRPASAV